LHDRADALGARRFSSSVACWGFAPTPAVWACEDWRVLQTLSLSTRARREFIDVTERVQAVVNVADGMCVVSSPHTTLGVTLNENADPDVVTDLLDGFADVIGDERRFKHAEGNSGAHALTSLVGTSVTLPIAGGRLVLGQWQAIYVCEFDGPRQRTLHVQVMGER
jgi:secondary thiamine-phosphate synthase enzyme